MTTATSTHDEPMEEVGGQTATSDQPAHTKPSYDDINTPVIVLVGVISALVTFLTIAFVEGLSYHWENGLILERSYNVENPRQVQMIDDQKAKLQGDQQAGILSVDAVVDDVIARYQERKQGKNPSIPENESN